MTQDGPAPPGMQRFRTGAVIKDFELIDSHVPGEKSFVFVEDVLYAFNTEAARFEAGTMALPFMRDPGYRKYVPERIACRPGLIIDIVQKPTAAATMPAVAAATTPPSTVTSQPSTVTTESPCAPSPPPYSESSTVVAEQSIPEVSESLADPPASHHSSGGIAQPRPSESPAPSVIEQIAESRESNASTNLLDNIPEHAISQLSIQETRTLPTTPNAFVETNNQDATEALFEGYVQSRLVHLVGNTDTMLRLQQETLDRLTIVQNKAEAILTQNFELLEYTIPRLFVVLPDTTSSRWDPSNILGTKFRLHFICECGEHTRTATSRIPHHLHLAKHDGYEIQEANAFFSKYAGFLTTMLEILKFGLNITGFVVPALATLNLSQTGDASVSSRDGNGKSLVEGVDRSISFLEQFKASNPSSLATVGGSDAVSIPGGNASGLEGLEGVDLRQLARYLKVGDSANLLGNLYRMTTKEGHVKWVCRDHYRAGYQEANYQKLHEIVKAAGGIFDEQLGRITVTIKSGIAAAQLYDAIGTSRGIHELVFTMAWEQENSDLVKLKNMIKKSSIVALTLDLQQKAGSGSDFSLTGNKRYDPIVTIMQLSSVTAIHILSGPKDFFQRANFSKSQYYPGLRSIHIGDYFKGWDTMTQFLRRAPNIERVTLKAYGNQLSSRQVLRIFTTIS
ncbi:hypothetical protein EMPS_09004 [Entomortierella parvispora]|uniref:Uncharacterized protein n=1 Tax=Entomortierella parvispora TaxID=205924 RepID=A0A9P3M065_9FUNG|nr:hypothetical protein EMPS_09004 [Entomortierella parvispora]